LDTLQPAAAPSIVDAVDMNLAGTGGRRMIHAVYYLARKNYIRSYYAQVFF